MADKPKLLQRMDEMKPPKNRKVNNRKCCYRCKHCHPAEEYLINPAGSWICDRDVENTVVEYDTVFFQVCDYFKAL